MHYPRFNLLILCYWLRCHLLVGATLLYMPQPQAQMQQQQQQQQQQQFASTSQIASALEQNGPLVQALAQMYTIQPADSAPTASGTASAPNGTQTPNSNQFVIKVIYNDQKNNQTFVNISPVIYTNLHEPRIELRYQSKYPFVSLDERSPNNTLVAAVLVNDEDSGPNGETSVNIEQGNELGHFKLVNAHYSKTILVNGAPLSRARQPEYNLTIVARDHGSPPKSSSVNLVIKLNASSQSSYSTSDATQLKPPVTDLMYVGAMLVVIFSALIFIIIISCAVVQRPKMKGPPPRTRSDQWPCGVNVNLTNL